MKYIVVGSSHGGFEAVQQLLISDPKADIQWYEKGDFISFLSCGMQLYLEGIVKHVNDVSYAKPDEMSAKGVDVFVQQEIAKVDPANHSVHVINHNDDSERDESYDKLILSPGATPRALPIENNDLENVYFMRGRDWAMKLKQKTVDPSLKNVVVIGSGYIGVEAAIAFAKAGMNVTIVEHNQRMLGVYLDKEFTDILTKEAAANNVNFIGGHTVDKLVGKDGKVVAAVTDDGQEIPAELVVESAGITPNTKWLEGAVELGAHGIITTNDHMETSAKDVYAVGDATLVPFAPTGKDAYIALATNARREGRTAGLNATGHDVAMTPVSGSSALSFFNYHFASTGIKEGTASRYGDVKTQSTMTVDLFRPHFVPDEDGNAKVYFKLTYSPDDGRILGAQIMSTQDATENINAISLAIQAKLTVYDLAYADFFFQPDYDRPWNVMNVCAQQAVRDLEGK